MKVDEVRPADGELLERGRIVDAHPNLAPRCRLRESRVLTIALAVGFIHGPERHRVAFDRVARHLGSDHKSPLSRLAGLSRLSRLCWILSLSIQRADVYALSNEAHVTVEDR